jgi:hypothetical protein
VRLALALLGTSVIAAVGLGLGFGLAGGHASEASADTRPPNPMTPKIVACQRSGKLICDPAAYRRDRREGMFPLSKPDPKDAHLMTLRQVLPPAWRHEDYAAELMTYGQAQKLAPSLAGASRIVIDPSREFWVLTLYHRPPITVPNTETGPCCSTPSTITVRAESQAIDAVTGIGMDSCVNCAAIRELRYQPEGVTLMTPLPGYRPSLSRRAALSLFRSSEMGGSNSAGRPTVKLWTVRDDLQPRGGYPAWVITFSHTSPASYGLRQRRDCVWVAIYNLEARVWTWDFQNCPEYAGPPRTSREGAACDSGCTPANQPALDGAAGYAEKVAGAAHSFTGVEVDGAANQVVVYLDHAPQSVIDRLNAAHPGIYIIHDDAPRTHATLMRLENSFNFEILEPEGIKVYSVGPSVDGYLDVGVSGKVAEAQEKLDAIYGRNVVHVFKASPVIATAWASGRTSARFSAIRSTEVRLADAAEIRMWQKEPRAFMVAGDPAVLRFVMPGNGCKPKGSSGRVKGKALILRFQSPAGICTTQTALYEVTITFVTPIMRAGIKKVVLHGSASKPMRLVTIVYG